MVKCCELTWEEACTLYDAGLRDGVEFFEQEHADIGWQPDAFFNPKGWPKSIGYRIPIGDE